MTKANTDGFTIVEMLTVLMIAALALSVMASSPFGRPRSASASALARQIGIAVAALEAKAVTLASLQRVVVDVETRTVLVGQERIDIPSGLALSAKTGAELIVQEGRGVIIFFPDGTSSGGEIVLSETSGRSSIVQINWITGAVELIEPAK